MRAANCLIANNKDTEVVFNGQLYFLFCPICHTFLSLSTPHNLLVVHFKCTLVTRGLVYSDLPLLAIRTTIQQSPQFIQPLFARKGLTNRHHSNVDRRIRINSVERKVKGIAQSLALDLALVLLKT